MRTGGHLCYPQRHGQQQGGGVIIPLSSAIRGSQHPHIEDPNYLRTQNVPGLHTLMNARKAYHICMYENHARPTYTITPILHVRKTRPAYIHNYPNSACTKNTHLHALGPQFCMYTKKSPTYMHNYSNSACTRNTPGLHTQCTQSLCRGTHPHTLCHAQRSPQG